MSNTQSLLLRAEPLHKFNSCILLISFAPWTCSPLVSLLYPWDFPGKNMGEGCHFLL